jgi:hypothetical protein
MLVSGPPDHTLQRKHRSIWHGTVSLAPRPARAAEFAHALGSGATHHEVLYVKKLDSVCWRHLQHAFLISAPVPIISCYFLWSTLGHWLGTRLPHTAVSHRLDGRARLLP